MADNATELQNAKAAKLPGCFLVAVLSPRQVNEGAKCFHRTVGLDLSSLSIKSQGGLKRPMARWALLALLPTALADLETALAQEECTDPDTCSLQLLHVRGNKTESDLKADYQPGRETGVSCMWSNCEDKLGLVECHHWRCVCLPTAKWSSELLTCVKAEEPAEGQDTGGSCGWFACSKTRGPTRCERGKCQCTDGYVSFGGKCYQTTTTTTSQTETWPDAVISAPVPVPPPAPKQPPPKQISWLG
ncbi:Uncharacterized protein SCF082_LOCUS13600 [Durusdinium trenchii]|uniref:Uncharacterized protein n=1 Tax=Durusdinium trenchii TaxID=1381693 RepID=A0ABP0JSC3_9DINO